MTEQSREETPRWSGWCVVCNSTICAQCGGLCDEHKYDEQAPCGHGRLDELVPGPCAYCGTADGGPGHSYGGGKCCANCCHPKVAVS